MQVFASKKVYMFFYGVIGIINVSHFEIRKWLSSPIFKNIVALRLPQRHMGDSQIGLCQTKRTPDLLQGMQYTYLSTMLSTLEKKFGIKSKETVRRSPWWKNNGGWSLHLQAYLMSGNEIAQILFLFFLPITVKVGYTRCWHIQLSHLCLLLAHSRGFVEFVPTGKEKAAMVWNWIGHYKVCFPIKSWGC